MSEETRVSDTRAGQEGPTPDFIPGWFAPRDGNPDPAVREAVRIPDPGDFFPITFLRSTERVSPSQRPQLGFTIGTTSQPGHARFDLAVPPGYWIVRDADGKLYNWRDEDFKAKYRRSERDWTPPVERDVPSGRPAAAERATLTEPKAASEIGKSASEVDAERRDQLRYVEGWQGTPPAEGTRRALIRDTLEKELSVRHIATGDALPLADAIEESLIHMEGAPIKHRTLTQIDKELHDQRRDLAECYRLTGADPSDGSDAMLAREALDEVRRFRAEYDELEEAIAKVGEALDRIDAPQGATYAERIDRLYRELRGQLSTIRDEITATRLTVDKLRAEGKVKPGTKELVIVLEDVSDADQPPEYRFIELEDQDGAGVGGFGIKPSSRKPFLEITIPYGRDDAWVSEVAYQAAGAATRPLLEDHPDYVFPSERVSDAVAELLSDFGIARACRDCATEQLEHGAKEVDGRRDDTIKGLSERCDQLLEQRESARVGEDHFKAQRDSALHLVRWLIGDIIPPDLIRFGDDEEARS